MCLGALVDAGVPLDYLTHNLQALGIGSEYELHAEQVHQNAQQATKVHVTLTPNVAGNISQHSHASEANASNHLTSGSAIPIALPRARHLPEIEQLIIDGALPIRAKKWSLAIFQELAEAEAAVHGIERNRVHFHEVGATDAIVDIVGTALGLDWLGIDRLYCSPLPTGGGTVWAAHGHLNVPAPAVLKLWERHQVPVYSNGIERELVTPTGAAIAVTLSHSFGPPPAMTLHKIGLGAGSHQLPLPNRLRLWIGESSDLSATDPGLETIIVLETQVDDLNPQAIGYTFDALFAAGALDVFTQAIGMKKSRPGVLITVLCQPEKLTDCETVLFRETSTLGIRRSQQQRTVLARQIQSIETEYGPVRVKVARQGNTIVNVQPEYEDCVRLAQQHHLAWREVQRIVLHTWYASNTPA